MTFCHLFIIIGKTIFFLRHFIDFLIIFPPLTRAKPPQLSMNFKLCLHMINELNWHLISKQAHHYVYWNDNANDRSCYLTSINSALMQRYDTLRKYFKGVYAHLFRASTFFTVSKSHGHRWKLNSFRTRSQNGVS